MNTLMAELRDTNTKAKKLRRDGFVPGNLYGKDLEDSICIQFTGKEADNFIRSNKKGAHIALSVGKKKYDVMLKDFGYNPLKKQIMNIDFQLLVADEKIHGTAQIVVTNEDSTTFFVHQELSELEYKAFPADIVEQIEVDIAKFPEGESIHVKDLDICNNKKIEVTTPMDDIVVHISDHVGKIEPEETEDEEAAAPAVESSVQN